MRPWIPLACLAMFALAGSAGAQEGAVPSGALREEAVPLLLQRAVDDFIRPGYRNLFEATTVLSAKTEDLCEAPAEAALDEAHAAFDMVVKAWSAIEIVRVGPVIEGNRFERILFYPDRKGTGLRQVQALLAKPDEEATDWENLKGKSVAMQGLGALEFVLYGTGWENLTEEPRGFRCRYGAAIAKNIESIAGELATEWDAPGAIQDAWKHPGRDNPVFRDNREAVTAVLGILVHATEAIKDQRLRPFYRGIVEGKPGKGHPKLAIYWRSGNTLPSIHANIEGLKTLWETAGMRTLLEPGFQSVAGSIDFILKSLLSTSVQIDLPVDQLLKDEAQRGKLDFVVLNIQDLLDRLNREYGGAIGLSSGFSFADGD